MPDYRLENAIADLDAVYVENEEDRKTLSGVNRAIERLRNRIRAGKAALCESHTCSRI